MRSSSSSTMQDMACARLAGEKLRRIEIDPATGNTVFGFDLGGVLTVTARGAFDDKLDELWFLNAPGHRGVAIHGGGHYRVGSTRTEQGPKRPLILLPSERSRVLIGAKRIRR